MTHGATAARADQLGRGGDIVARYERALDRLRATLADDPVGTIDEAREWCFRHVLRSLAKDRLTTLHVINTGARATLREIYDKRVGFWCGGTAHMLTCVYDDLGLNSATLAHGITGLTTHAVTIVEVAGRSYLQDPHFNYRLVAPDDREADFEQILKGVAGGGRCAAQQGRGKLTPVLIARDADIEYCRETIETARHVCGDEVDIALQRRSWRNLVSHWAWDQTFAEIQNGPTLPGADPFTAFFAQLLWVAAPRWRYSQTPLENPWVARLYGPVERAKVALAA